MAGRTLMKIPEHVETILRQAKVDGPNNTHLRIVEKLTPKVYADCKKILTMLGGQWNKGLQATVFPKPIKEVLAEALDDGTVKNEKNIRQAFYTPDKAADLLAEAVQPEVALSYLEPSAGGGALIRALQRKVGYIDRLVAIETDQEECEKLANDFPFMMIRNDDFLNYKPLPHRQVDRIIMNPPYSGGQDVEHILHAYKFLKPDGILAAIAPPSILRKDTGLYAEFNALMKSSVRNSWAPLPKDSFKESGTIIDTCIIVMHGRKA